MLEYAYDYKDVLTMYCNEHFPEIGLITYDWDVSYIIKEFLEIFNMATNFFSGVYYLTTFMTIKRLYYISDIFSKYRHGTLKNILKKLILFRFYQCFLISVLKLMAFFV